MKKLLILLATIAFCLALGCADKAPIVPPTTTTATTATTTNENAAAPTKSPSTATLDPAYERLILVSAAALCLNRSIGGLWVSTLPKK